MPNNEYNPAPPEDLVASGGTCGGQPAASIGHVSSRNNPHPDLVEFGVLGDDAPQIRKARHELHAAIYRYRAGRESGDPS